MIIPVRGHNLFVKREGTGRPIVLIHGLGTTSVWNKVWGPLSASYDLLNVHLPGFGSSAPSTTSLSVRDHALLVKGVIEHLGLQDAALMGTSYGGQIAATLAAMNPASVTALVLICPAGLMTRYRILRWKWLSRVVKMVATNIFLRNEKMLRRLNGRLYVDPANQPPEIVMEYLQMVRDPERRRNWFECVINGAVPAEGFRERLSEIRVPTLILWGREDRVIPARYAAAYGKMISRSTTEILAECGHALPLEQPAMMCGALRRFLEAAVQKP